MYDGEIIRVNDKYRLRVEVDQDAENPLEWGWGTEIHEIDNYRIWRGWETPDDPVAKAAYCFHQKVRRREWTSEQRDRAIRGYLALCGDERSFEVREWRGYSKSDWATVLVLWDEKTGGNVYETWAAWRRGDVFTVIAEKATIYRSDEDPEDVIWDWEELESLGGCYLGDDYTAWGVAEESFESFPEVRDEDRE